MSLPNPSMSFSPFAILTAEELNELVENIESLADGSGIGDGAIGTTALQDGSVTPLKLNLTKSTDANSWKTYDYGNFKKYIKTFSVNVGLSGGTRADVGDLGSPVGSPTTHVSGIAWQGTFAGHAIVGIQGNDIYLGNGTGSTLTFTGTITVELTDA